MTGVLLHLLESSFRSTAKRLAHVKLVLEGAASAALLDPGRAPLKCLRGPHILVAPRAEYLDPLGGLGLSPAEPNFLSVGFTGCGKLLIFVGRAFKHDIKVAFSSGVLTPEGIFPQPL